MRKFTIDEVRAVLQRKMYVFFGGGRYNLNIIGVRAKEQHTNTFNDCLLVIYRDKNLDWQIKQYPITTDPGTYYLEHPMNVEGTAIMLPGQYLRCYAIGLHRKQYKALVQTGAIDYVRDGNLNAVIDIVMGKKKSGVIGANIHRASAVTTSKKVDKWSAACQVFADPNHFNEFMELCVKSTEKPYDWPNKFSYTLLEEKDFF